MQIPSTEIPNFYVVKIIKIFLYIQHIYVYIWKDVLNETQNLLYMEEREREYFVPYISYMGTKVEKVHFSSFHFPPLFRNPIVDVRNVQTCREL